MHTGDYYHSSSSSSPYYSHPYPNTNPTESATTPQNYASAPPYASYPTTTTAAAMTSPYTSPPPPSSYLPPPAPSQSPQFTSFPPTYTTATAHNNYPYDPKPPPPASSAYVPQVTNPSPYPSFDPTSHHDTSASYFGDNASRNTYSGNDFNKSSAYSYGDNLTKSSIVSDTSGNYLSSGAGGYGRSVSSSGYEQDYYGKIPITGNAGYRYDGLDDGAYAYDGGRGAEPYGARAMRPARSGEALFDDYGRSISLHSNGEKDRWGGGSGGLKVVRAVPKTDTSEDVKNGVQKFRVKLLPEGAGSPMDVLCQVGLDGIRMIDPNTNRTLRIYPLETVTRWDVLDSSSVFAFWSKSSVEIEARRIRLKSNSYTTNTIVDTVTAATIQFKEMGGSNITRSKAIANADKPSEAEKKKGLIDWKNLIKPANEEKDHWMPDEAVSKCTACGGDFSAWNRRHHCRNCGDIFCDKCTQGRIALTADADAQPVRVCEKCMAEVSQRLNNAKEAANRPILRSHEDLAKKLQEAMNINRKSSSGSKSSDGSGRRMREVACPTCTVHLQVQVPVSGSETIECGVCQHPFLVSAR